MLTALPGCDVNVKGVPDNVTPLLYLMEDGVSDDQYMFEPNMDIVRTLIQAGADVNLAYKRCDGLRPIHFAAQHDHVELMKVLLDAGAQVRYTVCH